MSAVPSTPFPIPAFNSSNNTTPAEFLKFLRSLVSQYLGDDCPRITENKIAWVTIVDGLADHFLGSFPLPDMVAWSTMEEKVVMTEVTLDVTKRVFSRVNDIYNGSEILLKKVIVRLLDLCRALDVWMEMDVICGDKTFLPSHMKERAFDAIVSVLRGMGSNDPILSGEDNPSWKVLRAILEECIEIGRDLVAPTTPLTSCTILRFFQKPRIVALKDQSSQEQELEGSPLNVVITALNRMPSFLALLINIMTKVLLPPLKCQWFLVDIFRMTAELSKEAMLHFLHPSCATTSLHRTKALIDILSTTLPLRRMTEYRGLIGNFPEFVLQIRMDSVVKLEWDLLDPFLLKLFATEEMPLSKALAHSVLYRLKHHGEGNQDVLWSYLQSVVPHMDDKNREAMAETIKSMDESPQRDTILKELASNNIPQLACIPKSDNGRLTISPRLWRQRLHIYIGEIIAPDALSWMDDDEEQAQDLLCRRALYEIQTRYEQRSLESWSNDRAALIEKIASLPCFLLQCDKTDCMAQNLAQIDHTVNPYIPVISCLLSESPEEATSDIRRRTYQALCQIFKHHNHNSQRVSEVVINIVFQGMNDLDRSVRVSAGYALNSLIQSYSLHGKDGFRNADPIFSRLYQCFEVAKNPIRETLLVSVGAMGKSCNPDILGQVLCLLVAQLGRQNPVIKGSACMHVLAIAKHCQMAPYKLMHPYQDQVAPFIIQRLSTQPDLLGEACRVMAIAPADFITITLPYTLPRLFASCDEKVLDSITKLLSTKASSLLLKHSHGILAHIFLLPSQAATTKALAFVIKVLTDATSSSIDVQSVVKSCVVPLLAELVVVMGDENNDIATQGVKALKRVEQILGQKRRIAAVESDLGTFLKTYMLGLISDINDMLQDVQGKKSVDMKRKILRSLGALVHQIGPMISHVSPQIMATFQTMVSIPELSEVTLDSWFRFLTTLGSSDLGPHVGPTSAAIVTSWPSFSYQAREIAFQCLEYLICTMGPHIGHYISEVVDISNIEQLLPLDRKLKTLRGILTPENDLQRILKQISSDNLTVAVLALRELIPFMLHDHKDYIQRITSGDSFDPIIGQILATLFATACRDSGEGSETLRLLAFECIGVLGAVDPDRCEIPYRDTSMVVMKNYTDDGEAVIFALHLIQDLLVGAFRSTSDIKYQSHLAYSIQELLKFCQFTPALVAAGQTTSIPVRVRNRWNTLPKHVLETVTPLLEGRFTLNQNSAPDVQHPIYPTQSTYREWIQLWASDLITKVSGPVAQRVFGVFRSAVRNKDVVVAHHLLPHLVLSILISGNDDDALAIRTEIITVLNDQVDIESNSTSDKKLLSAQAVFMLLDHLNKWVRIVRQEIAKNSNDNKRPRSERGGDIKDQLLRLDSILANIDQSLMAKAAFQCKAYARSLMDFEQQIFTLKERGTGKDDLPGYYEKLHEIYSHLDEPDGMEGISTLIVSPTLEHQIRQHESTGRWTSAQSCWELRLQESPHNVEFHLGLLRCLRNLGHYDTLRTHVAGVLTRHPDWEATLADFQIESAWMVGAWDDVQSQVDKIKIDTSAMVTARVILAMRSGEPKAISDALSDARSTLGAPITAGGSKGYRRSYQAVLDLHAIQELELIYQTTCCLQSGSQEGIRMERRHAIAELSKTLSARLGTTLPTFRTREPLLSMRRTAFTLSKNPRLGLNREIGKAWLASAKIARRAAQWQTAYNAMLQAQQRQVPYSFIESAKLVNASGEPLRALHDLENSVKYLGLFDENVLDLTMDKDADRMKAKIQLLRGRWMNESDRYETKIISTVLEEAIRYQKTWESAQYYVGQFYDECFKELPINDQVTRGMKMVYMTIKTFARSLLHGSKFTYRTVPRLLTIWLDFGEIPLIAQQQIYKQMTDEISRAIRNAPVFKWFTAFPQIVSRVGHGNPEIFSHLSRLIVTIMQTYPRQSLWLFTSVVKSTKSYRQKRGKEILRQLQSHPASSGNGVSRLIGEALSMTNELLNLCDFHVDDNRLTLSMTKHFPKLKNLGRSNLIIPLQESLTATLPPDPSSEATHQPFPLDTPTFHEFSDEIEVMKSLAKPRKITIRGSNGQTYMFLGKPKDDLRKDARLMEMNSIINKLLKGNSESRRRQLHIRTYGVVALNEECGFIQWVPNTTAMRAVLIPLYDRKGVKNWPPEVMKVTADIKRELDINVAAEMFKAKILSMYKPVFHEWFVETFPEPTAWLASRLTYGRTAAVMSMVGFILGLGDRHTENILLDVNSGDVVHVDFNCLFEKGKNLETPERVPFRLTQNMVDGLGISGVEGVFRIACEVTMQLLRDNKDSLMSVLDAFVHDPLVEWEDEKRKRDREAAKTVVKAGEQPTDKKVALKDVAKSSLTPIEKKLNGIFVPYVKRERPERPMSTSNLVQLLIQDATDNANLAKMYAGWTPWH